MDEALKIAYMINNIFIIILDSTVLFSNWMHVIHLLVLIFGLCCLLIIEANSLAAPSLISSVLSFVDLILELLFFSKREESFLSQLWSIVSSGSRLNHVKLPFL